MLPSMFKVYMSSISLKSRVLNLLILYLRFEMGTEISNSFKKTLDQR